MATDQIVSLESAMGALVLRGEDFSEGNDWQVLPLGRQRYLIEKTAIAATMKGSAAGSGLLHCKVFVALLMGLVDQEFDGVLSLDMGDCVKRLYFKGGELVFAASNLIDDRLGEVLYRAGQISLDQLMGAAVEVNRTTKFGRVLLTNEVFTCSQLWDALKLQVLSIFQSTFLYDFVYVQIAPGEHQSPTAVSMDEPTKILIDDFQGHAEVFRQFKRRLGSNSVLHRVESTCNRLGIEQGTFTGDMVELVSRHSGIQDFVTHSKLTDINTLAGLFDLVNHHIIKAENYDSSTRGLDSGADIKTIKGLLDAYHLIMEGAKKAFMAESVDFPVLNIEIFLDQQYNFRRSPVFVLPDGTIAPEAVVSIYTKARTSARQGQVMASQMQGLILFLLQVVGDSLPSGKGWELKRSFQNMVT